jgi:hypothetical protein
MRTRFGLIAALLPVLAACDDDFVREWTARPDTVLLYSLSRPEYIGRASAFNFIIGSPVVVEQLNATGNWDLALVDQGNDLALVPASAFVGLSSRAAVAEIGPGVLEDVRQAPGDTAQFRSTPVPIRLGTIYIIRSRRDGCSDGFGSGVYYSKMEAIEIDKAAGTLRFRTISNPFCNDRALIPPN